MANSSSTSTDHHHHHPYRPAASQPADHEHHHHRPPSASAYTPPSLPPASHLPLPIPAHNPQFPPSHPNTLPLPVPSFPLRPYHSPPSFPPPLIQKYAPSPTSSSGSGSSHSWPSHHTSQMRDDPHPAHHHHHQHQQQHAPPSQPHHHHQRRDSMNAPTPEKKPQPPAFAESSRDADSGMPPTSDFVKKLYKMLEDNTCEEIVSWGPAGDCFVVKDMTEFTKSVLPRMFKHSNFASFVRQLNKYDFHKVKNTEDSSFGEHSWTFRHPDFRADNREALENIKRKVPTSRKSAGSAANGRAGSSNQASGDPNSPTSLPSPAAPSASINHLQMQIDAMVRVNDELKARVAELEQNYQNVVDGMVHFQRDVAAQDGIMQNLISYFVQLEGAKGKAAALDEAQGSQGSQFVQSEDLPSAYNESVARATFEQMNEISRRAYAAGMQFRNGNGASRERKSGGEGGGLNAAEPPAASTSSQPMMGNSRGEAPSSSVSGGFGAGRAPASMSAIVAEQEQKPEPPQPPQPPQRPQQQQQQQAPMEEEPQEIPRMPNPGGFPQSFLAATSLNPGPDSQHHAGLHVLTLGHLMPRDSLSSSEGDDPQWQFPAHQQQQMAGPSFAAPAVPLHPMQVQSLTTPSIETSTSPTTSPSGRSRSIASQHIRVRRSTFVPGWAVPPRVLLVEDDVVSRRLSSKFLQVSGCTIDVAVDGVGAVNKMNLEKYDLVLMDIVMPKLDGVTATSLIRQFDHRTPIISMTSNSKPNEIMTYYSHGMNDILPKPFTKEGLFTILEKHLTHLKQIQQLSRVPRSLSPMPDGSMDNSLALTVNPSSSLAAPGLMSEDDGKLNPLAGLGMSDEQYSNILQNLLGATGEIMEEAIIMDTSTEVVMPSEINNSIGLSNKRGLDNVDDVREGKRGRFEVIE